MLSLLSPLLLLLPTLPTAFSSPLLTNRQKTPLDYPPRIISEAFTLIANVTSSPPTNPIFSNPPIQNWVLTTERVGAGRYAAILSPPSTIHPGRAVLFLNGTTRDISAEIPTPPGW
jgi:hypothetical protein